MIELLIEITAILSVALITGTGFYLRSIKSQFQEAFSELDKKVEDTNDIVRRELRPNGGDSVFDRVSAIEKRMVAGDKQFEQLYQMLKEK